MTDVVTHWGLWGLALLYLLEGMAAPLPIEIPLWLSGQMLIKGTATYEQLVLFTWIGSAGGNVVAFALARIGGRPLVLRLARICRMQVQVRTVERWVDRYGLWFVGVSRWINWGFGISLWLTGFCGIPARRALSLQVVNNLLWACWWVFLGGFLVGKLRLIGLPDWLVLLPGLFVILAYGFWRLWRRLRGVRPRARFEP